MDFKGLLDDETLARIDQDAGLQQALALMAASGPSLMPQNLGSILLQGNQVRDESRQAGLKNAMQRQELLQQRQLQNQRNQLLGSLANAPNATQSALAGGGGPTMANAQKMQDVQGSNLTKMLDAYRQALLMNDGGKTADQIKKLIDLERPTFEYATSFEIEGEGGKPIAVAMGKDGTVRTVGGKAVKLETRDLGDRVEFINPYTNKVLGTSAKGQTPDSRASTELGYSRLNFEKEQATKPSYDFMTVDGRVMIGDKRTGQVIGQTTASPKDVQQVTGAVNAVLEAAPIIPKSTGSLVGRGMDLAAGAFGFGTEGAKNTAKLEVIGAKLTANVPRFEGPQSNIDVQFYKQAAADVANPLKPDSVRLEALRTAAQLIKKDAQTKGIPVPPEFETFLSGQEQSVSPASQSGVVDFSNLPRGR